jgi:hypothetical protein
LTELDACLSREPWAIDARFQPACLLAELGRRKPFSAQLRPLLEAVRALGHNETPLLRFRRF